MSDNIQSWNDYLALDTLYGELSDLKKKGWSTPAGDKFFAERRRVSGNPSRRTKTAFYSMTKSIGRDLVNATEILVFESKTPRILDLCMAPGGFSKTVKTKIPDSEIDAVTLPQEIGGLKIMEENVFRSIIFTDITMYPLEMTLSENIPALHPDLGKFEISRPLVQSKYDLIFCGGAVGRDHPREDYRDNCERSRLTVSQLVFAINRLQSGGSLVLLLHRVESWDTVCILHAFDKFSDVQLFKHPKFHAIKSSFYMVARRIDLEHNDLKQSVSYWKELWQYLTFKDFKNIPPPCSRLYEPDNDFVRKVQDEFGPQFIEIARPLWAIQAEALKNSNITKSNS